MIQFKSLRKLLSRNCIYTEEDLMIFCFQVDKDRLWIYESGMSLTNIVCGFDLSEW